MASQAYFYVTLNISAARSNMRRYLDKICHGKIWKSLAKIDGRVLVRKWGENVPNIGLSQLGPQDDTGDGAVCQRLNMHLHSEACRSAKDTESRAQTISVI
jgi:hypothetical protein